jgi:hypothetical protein
MGLRSGSVVLAVVAAGAAGLGGCAEEVVQPVDGPEPEPDAGPVIEEPPPPAESGSTCTDDDDCGADTTCAYGTCVGQGEFQITLSFEADTDLDLHVMLPSGEEIYYDNPAGGGAVLDVDVCVATCEAGTHVENVFFPGAVDSGLYSIWVENYDLRQPAAFELDVSGRGEASFSGYVDDSGLPSDTYFVTVE